MRVVMSLGKKIFFFLICVPAALGGSWFIHWVFGLLVTEYHRDQAQEKLAILADPAKLKDRSPEDLCQEIKNHMEEAGEAFGGDSLLLCLSEAYRRLARYYADEAKSLRIAGQVSPRLNEKIEESVRRSNFYLELYEKEVDIPKILIRGPDRRPTASQRGQSAVFYFKRDLY